MTKRKSESEQADVTEPQAYAIYGAEYIDSGALDQMNAAMSLPVSVAGALLPDAHIGYGLPIGGVLATREAVIPYAVGVDIACRMRLSLYADAAKLLERKKDRLVESIEKGTYFGPGATNPRHPDHAVLHDPAWQSTDLLKGLRDRAVNQLGTSGSGNHFVEWGSAQFPGGIPDLGVEPGTYLALLSHSGSRGFGFKVADCYSKQAEELHPELTGEARRLSWLDMESEIGIEYWMSMELAGRYASANHAVIHHTVAGLVGLEEVAVVENHHNFAWRESIENEEVIVHRKGATPAQRGVLGVIPGSMADPGFIVSGRGDPASLHSASHGAGRVMGRKQAIRNLTADVRDRYVRRQGVTLLGGGLDEAPQAYKSIRRVMAAQSDLVRTVGEFKPRIVKMARESRDI